MRSSLHFRQTSQRPQKAAKARVRKATFELGKLGKQYRKEVDKAFAQLKKDGAIVSPVRCKWQPAE